jgi:two-component system, response regulator / RNA-binding antiterminator
MHASAPRPVLMFSHDANQQLIREAVNAGVTAYLVEGLASERLAPILEVALARFAQESQLRERLAQAENELAERKLIDRAKRLLMDQQKLTEPAAYASLRKRAMNQGVKLAEVAREVVASAGLLK